MIPISLDLPIKVPPHNCLHVGSRAGRLVTTNATALGRRRQFRSEVAWLIPKSAKRSIAEPVKITIDIWRQADRAADGDNLQKEILDALVEAGVLKDDTASVVRSVCWTVQAQGRKVENRLRIRIEDWTS